MNTQKTDRFTVAVTPRYSWFRQRAVVYLLSDQLPDGRLKLQGIGGDTLTLIAPNVSTVSILSD